MIERVEFIHEYRDTWNMEETEKLFSAIILRKK
jgi:uncharacterized protein YutD